MTTLNNPEAWLARQAGQRALTVLVFFRGSWCPFCQAYLREFNGAFLDQVRAVGGELIAVTSQSQGAADVAKDQWQLQYPVVSDPSSAVARQFGVAITPKEHTPLAGSPTEYPEGMAQPAVIALDRDGRVLFRWAIDPNETNLGGASDRPLPMDLWRVIKGALEGEAVALDENRPRLDPAFLECNYPAAHQIFCEWAARAQNG